MRVPHICKPVTPPPPPRPCSIQPQPHQIFLTMYCFVNLFSLFVRFQCVNNDGEVPCP